MTPRCDQCGAEVTSVMQDGQGVDLSGLNLGAIVPPLAPPLLHPCGHRSRYTQRDTTGPAPEVRTVVELLVAERQLADALATALLLVMTDDGTVVDDGAVQALEAWHAAREPNPQVPA